MPFWSNAFRDFTDADLPPDAGGDAPTSQPDDDRYSLARRRMVEQQLRRRDITDARVLEAVGRVARDRFVPAESRHQAYKDHPLPIGLDQTISQPYIVALMTQLVRPAADSRALEVGVGSGYQTAILAELCREVYGVEILEPLATAARGGWPRWATRTSPSAAATAIRAGPNTPPSTSIIVSAAPDHVPQPLWINLPPAAGW